MILNVNYAEHSATLRRDVTAGSAVSLDCTLDVDCFTEPVRWVKSPEQSEQLWYNGQQINPKLNLSGVSVENDATRGLSVLTMEVRLEYRGSFRCYVAGIQKCQINFQLTVTGKIYLQCKHNYLKH